MNMAIVAALALLCAPAVRERTVHRSSVRFDLRPDRCAAARRSHDDSRRRPSATAQTGAAGDFAFPDLPEGDYEISAELSGFERARRAVRVRAGERVTVSFTLRVAIVEETIVTAAKAGERDVQTIPMAISAVSNAELARLGTPDTGRGAALAPSVTLSQNTGFGQLTIRGIGANVVNAGSDPSSAMYLDGVYLARPAMAFVQFLDLDRIEVLRGPQGTLYGRNAVGGAINLISRPPTNDFQASADVTAGNFGELRADARISGPLKRDQGDGIGRVRARRPRRLRPRPRASGPSAWRRRCHRGTRAAARRLRSPDGSAAVERRRPPGRHAADLQQGAARRSRDFTFDNPPDLHDVRASALASNRTLQYGASARLTMALTPSTTLVSLTAYRNLDYEFFVDADITELNLLTTHQHERQHQLSEEITISHQQPRLTWVGGVFLFDESDHQSFWVDQPAAANPGSARPARRRHQPRGVRTGDRRIDVPALGDRRHSLHARGEGHRQRRGTLRPR